MNRARFRAAVLTVSDSAAAGRREDVSGRVAGELVAEIGGEVVAQEIVADDLPAIVERLLRYAEELRVELVVTTGGTGLSPRDVTPEATRQVITREAPGLAELMRRETAQQTPLAALSRGVCGLRATTLIVNLPGNPKAVRQCLAALAPVLKHGLAVLSGLIGQHDSRSGGGEQPS